MSVLQLFFVTIFLLYPFIAIYCIRHLLNKYKKEAPLEIAGYTGLLLTPVVAIATMFFVLFGPEFRLPWPFDLKHPGLLLFLFFLPTIIFFVSFFTIIFLFSQKSELIKRKAFFATILQSIFVVVFFSLALWTILFWLSTRA